MALLGQYVTAVTAMALLCSVVTTLLPEGGPRSMLRMLCGLMLCVTALSPLIRLELSPIEDFLGKQFSQGETYTAMGENMARDAAGDIIKQQSEAYILDKAAQLEADLSVEVVLDETNIPVEVILSGQLSPYGKQRLEKTIAAGLGITKEHQLWTG